ncbi:MAG: ATP-binding cassette domain-containing protein [Propionibacteriaceae bacterium]|nr:ATP-binding cassette domain-containing protein [Propionibacteriaceae bacterium]
MESYHVEGLTFSYPGPGDPVLSEIELRVAAGDFVTLCGKSGCGKTTLLRHLKSVLTPHGERSGRVLFRGRDLAEWDQRTQAQSIGFVSQNPDNQIVTDKVWHELAFGLESLGCDNQTIRLRVAEMASFFGIEAWFDQPVSVLSGGQKQILNLASVLAMQPEALILDEPTSQLDPIAAGEFLATLRRINRELGVTVVLAEQRLEEVFVIADQVVAMDGGRIRAVGTPAEVGQLLRDSDTGLTELLPSAMRVFAEVGPEPGKAAECPVTVRDGRRFLAARLADQTPAEPDFPQRSKPSDTAALNLREVWFRYDKDGPDVLAGLSLKIPTGTIYAVMGGNGAGKTTMLSVVAGLEKPYRGKVEVAGRPLASYRGDELFDGLLASLPQDPRLLFSGKTVELDLAQALGSRRVDEKVRARIQEVAQLVEIEHLLSRHPYDLSGGEQQRAGLAKILLRDPSIILLDEPTKGLDNVFKQKLAKTLRRLVQRGASVVLVSHDIEFCAQHADLCALCFNGTIVTAGTPRDFFSGNTFFTTAANRIARDRWPTAITTGEVIELCQATLAASASELSSPLS